MSAKLHNNSILDFQTALYKATCPFCGDPIEWQACFDADGTDYTDECCGYNFRLSPQTVKFSMEESEK